MFVCLIAVKGSIRFRPNLAHRNIIHKYISSYEMSNIGSLLLLHFNLNFEFSFRVIMLKISRFQCFSKTTCFKIFFENFVHTNTGFYKNSSRIFRPKIGYIFKVSFKDFMSKYREFFMYREYMAKNNESRISGSFFF